MIECQQQNADLANRKPEFQPINTRTSATKTCFSWRIMGGNQPMMIFSARESDGFIQPRIKIWNQQQRLLWPRNTTGTLATKTGNFTCEEIVFRSTQRVITIQDTELIGTTKCEWCIWFYSIHICVHILYIYAYTYSNNIILK